MRFLLFPALSIEAGQLPILRSVEVCYCCALPRLPGGNTRKGPADRTLENQRAAMANGGGKRLKSTPLTCPSGLRGVWIPDSTPTYEKKTEEPGALDGLDQRANDSGERIFRLNGWSFLKSRQGAKYPIRSSERWRRKQRSQKMPSLPDLRHQVARLMNQPRC